MRTVNAIATDEVDDVASQSELFESRANLWILTLKHSALGHHFYSTLLRSQQRSTIEI